MNILKLGLGDYGSKFKTDRVANNLTQKDILIYKKNCQLRNSYCHLGKVQKTSKLGIF